MKIKTLIIAPHNDLIEHASEENSNVAELCQFFDGTQKYSTQAACLEELSRYHWEDGFICPKRDRQVSPTSGTVFEHMRLPMPKCSAVVYLMATD